MKDDPDHGFRVCVNALINKCLKLYASTVPLATDEIKKLHGFNYYLQVDGFSAYWSTFRSTVSVHTGLYRYARKVKG